jgi:AraC-like DNA-binding protein
MSASPARPSAGKSSPGVPFADRIGLFAHLNDVCYFAKDRQRRFIAANQALVNMLFRLSEQDILGRTDHELIPSYLADAYREDDLTVLNDGAEIINKVELVTHNDLAVYWYTTTKIPLRNSRGEIIGLEGMTREFRPASTEMGPYPELYRLVDYIGENFEQKLTIEQLAQVAGMTVRTFERRFKERFHISPISYLKKVRINSACRQLTQTNNLLADIAQRCGFCDQSYMTKEFTRIMKTTPQAYRRTHAGDSQSGTRLVTG